MVGQKEALSAVFKQDSEGGDTSWINVKMVSNGKYFGLQILQNLAELMQPLSDLLGRGAFAFAVRFAQ